MSYRTSGDAFGVCERHPQTAVVARCEGCRARLCNDCADFECVALFCSSCGRSERARQAARRAWMRALGAAAIVAVVVWLRAVVQVWPPPAAHCIAETGDVECSQLFSAYDRYWNQSG